MAMTSIGYKTSRRAKTTSPINPGSMSKMRPQFTTMIDPTPSSAPSVISARPRTIRR